MKIWCKVFPSKSGNEMKEEGERKKERETEQEKKWLPIIFMEKSFRLAAFEWFTTKRRRSTMADCGFETFECAWRERAGVERVHSSTETGNLTMKCIQWSRLVIPLMRSLPKSIEIGQPSSGGQNHWNQRRDAVYFVRSSQIDCTPHQSSDGGAMRKVSNVPSAPQPTFCHSNCHLELSTKPFRW